jgi:hypothetical protein
MRDLGKAGPLASAAETAGVELDIRALDVAGAFANAQSSEDAAAVVVEAATTGTPKFRWQTSAGAAAFAGLSLGDLDGSRVLSATAGWLG